MLQRGAVRVGCLGLAGADAPLRAVGCRCDAKRIFLRANVEEIAHHVNMAGAHSG